MKIIFLTGHRKSGTTVFHRLFDNHPGINIFPVDLSVFYAYFPCFTNADKSAEELRQRLELVLGKCLSGVDGYYLPGSTHPFKLTTFLQVLNDNIDDSALTDRPHILNAMLNACAETCGLPADRPWVVKETSQAIFIDDFLKSDDEIKFLNILRDPRDNYAALKAGVDNYYAALGEDEHKTLASLINRVRMDFMASMVYEHSHPENFLTVRFEALAHEPDTIMRDVSDFCSVAYDDALTRPTSLGYPFEGNSHEGKKFSGLSMENVGKWHERISEFEAKVIEFWLQDVMEKYGYSLSFLPKDSARAFAQFYEWYNCAYFYHDSFAGGGT